MANGSDEIPLSVDHILSSVFVLYLPYIIDGRNSVSYQALCIKLSI